MPDKSIEEVTKRRLLHKIRSSHDLTLLCLELEREPVEAVTFAKFTSLYTAVCKSKTSIEEMKEYEVMGLWNKSAGNHDAKT